MPRRPSTHIGDPVAVGRRLRKAREAAGVTQRDLSFEGCTAAYISRIEAGARVPSLQILHEFGRRLGVRPEYLATGSQDPEDLSSGLLEAEVALRLGDEELAAELYEAARAAADLPADLAQAQLGLGPGDASAAANALGRSYASQSRYDEAFAVFERFFDEARGRGDHFDQVRFALLLANAYIDHGDYGRAHATLGEVLDLARKTVDPTLRASLYWSQSRLHLSQGEPDRAAEYAQL